MKIKATGLLMMVLGTGCGGREATEAESAASASNELMGVYANTYDYASVCPTPAGGAQEIDAWRFYKCECVSYAADKLNERGIPFNNSYKGVTWGWAGNWVTAATAAGIPVSTTAKAGSIAWWSTHVAYVDSVNADGTANVSEYNWGTTKYIYGTRKVTATKYIHF